MIKQVLITAQQQPIASPQHRWGSTVFLLRDMNKRLGTSPDELEGLSVDDHSIPTLLVTHLNCTPTTASTFSSCLHIFSKKVLSTLSCR